MKARADRQQRSDREREELDESAVKPQDRHALLELQRTAGNQAVSQLLRQIAPEQLHEQVQVSDDRQAEAEADRIAEKAVAQLGDEAVKQSPVAGNAIAPDLRRALASAAPNLGPVDRVRVHNDANAQQAADAFDARAYTSGRDVAVGRGELGQGVESHRLVAHEAVHAVQHQSPAAAQASVVHAKLRGTRDALVAKGGGQTSGKLRKLVHTKTNWDKICDAVGAYEEMEAVVLKNGNPTSNEMTKIAPRLLGQLAKIEAACAAWEKANKPEEANKKREKAHKKFLEDYEPADSDTREKADRRQAIALLLPRVRLEMSDLQSGRWTQGMGLSDSKKTDQVGVEKEGGVNKVKELHYATESGNLSGYFKEDKGFASKNFQGHEAQIGIRQMDPNYGARTVAMYRLDQLFGANVTSKAEFAVHDGKLGTVLESAKGEEAANVKWALDEQQQRDLGPGAVLTSDPVLQRAMNKLQIFDAICGQLDRHQGNWYVDYDPKSGKVRGIKGIDLDMAFGSEHEDPDQRYGENYLGLPPMMDAEFANRLLLVLPQEIRTALRGLLSDAEIEATVRRFEMVKVAIRNAQKDSKLVDQWDEKTAEDNRPKESTMRSGHKTYGSQMSGNAITDSLAKVKVAVKEALAGNDRTGWFENSLLYLFNDMPNITANGIRGELDFEIGYLIPKNAIWSGDLPAGQAVEWAIETLNDILGDDSLMARMEVAVQEMGPDELANKVIQKIMQPAVQAALKRWMSSHPKQKQPV